MAYEAILYEVEDRVATITLNKPERLNAFDDQMLADWHDAIVAADRIPASVPSSSRAPAVASAVA
ncbi:MAG: hypothetical protein R3B97_17655 [Dehalococcoidia bacterium]